jgi:DNA-binding GntR family transcriptional regulator
LLELRRLAPSDGIADTVYEALRDAIFSGAAPPGSKLSVPAIAVRLGVSRSPVREAVLRLKQEQLAEYEPRRGAVVAHIGTGGLASLYEVRGALEGLATRLAVERAGPDFIAELEALHAKHKRAVTRGDLRAHREADIEFHRRIRQESRNSDLLDMLDRIETRVRLAMVKTSITGGPDRAIEDHAGILEAIRSGDPGTAEARARKHIDRLRHSLLAGLTPEQQS